MKIPTLAAMAVAATAAAAPALAQDDGPTKLVTVVTERLLRDRVAEGRRVIANIERVANLFVTKTVYAMLLVIGIAIAGLVFPFLPRHLTLVGSLTIGIPSFFLALEATHRRYRPGFLGRVLRFAIPAGAVAAASTFSTSPSSASSASSSPPKPKIFSRSKSNRSPPPNGSSST